MNQKNLINHIQNTFDNCKKIIIAKNSDYASVNDAFLNFRHSAVVGVDLKRGILVRIIDKITRINNLLDRENVVKEEKIEDSISDLINYSAILSAVLKDEKIDKIENK